MFQLECIQIQTISNSEMVNASFELLLNGLPTHQFVAFKIQPDYCEIGDSFDLTASTFNQEPPIISRMSEYSLN